MTARAGVIGSWFTIRGRKIYSGGSFILQRITGILMVAFVILHFTLFELSLSIGYNYYLILVPIAAFHGLNGLRLAIHEFGIGYRYRSWTFIIVVVLWFALTYILITLDVLGVT